MKTMKYLSMMLVMLAMSVCMFSCGDDDDDIPNTITGKWTQTNGAGTVITLTFNSNKTGKITIIVMVLAIVMRILNMNILKKIGL